MLRTPSSHLTASGSALWPQNNLKKVSIQGGSPAALCDATNSVRGAAWGEDGNIVFSLLGGGLVRVPEAGGTAQALGKLQNGDTSQRWPQILPGGQAILFTGFNQPTGFDEANIEVLLKNRQAKIVQRGGYFGRYLPSGHLVFIHNNTLFAVPFDVDRYETRGLPFPVFGDVAGNPYTGGSQLDFSRTGTLVYLSGKSATGMRSLVSIDARGKTEPLLSGSAPLSPRFSPDGKRLASTVNGDLVVQDLVRGSTTRLTSKGGDINAYAVWTPDGTHLVYGPATGGIFWTRADGSVQPQEIYRGKGTSYPGSFSPDGHYLAFHQSGETTGRDLWILSLDTSDPDHPKASAPQLFLATKGIDVEPAFSPDGQWLAYASNESGAQQVFVRPFPEGAAAGQAQVSTAPARTPMWSRTAKELLYVGTDGRIMVVPYTTRGRTFEPGKPRIWSETRVVVGGVFLMTDLAPDGKHVVALPVADTQPADNKTNLHLTFILNFFDYLKTRIPEARK